MSLHKSPLHELHLELGGHMVPFAGYEMPLHYRNGILKEHLHTRAAAGLFDVSHMGQLALFPLSSTADVASALEQLVPADIVGLEVDRQRYTQLTNENGGILDDLMVANRGDHIAIVVNAACKAADEAHLRARLSKVCIVERQEQSVLLALQGLSAELVLARLSPAIKAMRFMDVRTVSILGIRCEIARSGYTGEDGFEISVAAANAEKLVRALLNDPEVSPVGLGARDSLRLEAGLCLYGADIDQKTTPVEAALEWSIQRTRRAGGKRPGGFLGAETIFAQLANGVNRRRVGLQIYGRAPLRAGTQLFSENKLVGSVTSGCFGPSAGTPVAMAYVTASLSKIGTQLQAELRGTRVTVVVREPQLIPARYKRN